jgi:sporulation protein YlmC with PRC-barrel domain
MRVIRDVLDNQLVDNKGCKIGKVDGVVIVLRKDKPPRLAYLEVGMSTLAHRLHPRLRKLAEILGKRWGVRGGKSYRIPFSKVKHIGIDVKVDLEAAETCLQDWEKWLNEKIIRRIPGGG